MSVPPRPSPPVAPAAPASRAADAVRTLTARRVENGDTRAIDEVLAEETPVALLYNGAAHAVMMATPADLEDFAIGFSVSEGIVERSADVALVDVVAGGTGIVLHLRIPQAAADALDARARALAGRTGCGLCGTSELAAAIRPVRRVPATPAPRGWLRRFDELQSRQPLNVRTGAVHAAGVVAVDGTLFVREDIGRHVAIDKAIGAALRAGAVPRALLVTSRASYEVVHKAAQAGIGRVAAISAPTAFAVRLAEEAGLTLVGFARGDRHTVYAGVLADDATSP